MTPSAKILYLIAGAAFACSHLQATERDFETFPKIDIHVHIYEDVPAFHEFMEEINIIKVLNVSVRAMAPDVFEYRKVGARQLARDYPHSFFWASTFPLWNINEPGYVRETIGGLNESLLIGNSIVPIW